MESCTKKCPNWKLKIVGEGPEKISLEKEIKGLNLCNSVLLAGYSNNVRKEISESSIFVLISLYEGFGLVLLEAMACGLPLVAFACQFGPKDIIREGINGFLIENRSIENLSKKIILLIQNRQIRENMSHQALNQIKKFDLSNVISQWMNLFDSLVTKK